MKRNLLLKARDTKAIGTTVIVAIVIVIIVIAGVGAYVAISLTSKTTTTSTTSTTSTTTSSSTTSTSTLVSSTSSSSISSTSTTSTTTTSSTSALTSTLPSLTVLETGSSLLYPLMNVWAANLTGSGGLYTNIQIDTAATGSGTGQSSAESGTVQLGASDAYLTNTQAAEYPNILNIPVAVSAQQINYNLPQIPLSMHLNFSGPVLAGIYNGSITTWNNTQILAINPGAASILSGIRQTIIPIVRSDSSGDTFIFTSYLSFSDLNWNDTTYFGTKVNWPTVYGELAADLNSGMVATCQQNKYSIAYIGISYLAEAKLAGLGYANLENQAGNFVSINSTTIQAAANSVASTTPANERISIVFTPGAESYPIVNYEYLMVNKTQTAPGMAEVLQTILSWMIRPNYGNAPVELNQVNFIPLPASIEALSQAQINLITGP